MEDLLISWYVCIVLLPKTFDFLFLQVNPSLIKQFEQSDLSFVGQDVDGERMEIIELASKWAFHF